MLWFIFEILCDSWGVYDERELSLVGAECVTVDQERPLQAILNGT